MSEGKIGQIVHCHAQLELQQCGTSCIPPHRHHQHHFPKVFRLEGKNVTWSETRSHPIQSCPRPNDVSQGRLCFDLCDHAIFLRKWDDTAGLENYTFSNRTSYIMYIAALWWQSRRKKIYTHTHLFFHSINTIQKSRLGSQSRTSEGWSLLNNCKYSR